MSIRDKWAVKERALAERTSLEPPVEATPIEKKTSIYSNAAHGAVTHGKMAMLEYQNKELMAAAPRLLLDPKNIRPSKWANRHERAFDTEDFNLLKQDIESAGKNVQPIKVRPIHGKTNEYEVVFGHRRHRACLQLGFSVDAIVEQLTDEALFSEMDRENRQRSDLSPFEQGLMYKHALDEGLFTSLRQLAERLGVNVAIASQARDIANLPAPVLDSFSSPLRIQYRWSGLLKEAMNKDASAVIKRAESITERKKTESMADSEVLQTLIGKSNNSAQDAAKPFLNDKTTGATASYRRTKKSHTFEIKAQELTDKQIDALKKHIADVLSKTKSQDGKN